MKRQNLFMAVVILVVFTMCFAYQQGQLNAAGRFSSVKAGVVDVTKILETSELHKAWQVDMKQKEQAQLEADKKMAAEIAGIEAQLKIFKVGSPDFMKLQQELMQKTAQQEGSRAFYKQNVNFQMQSWTEQLYKKLEAVTVEVAKKNDLDFVFAKEDIQTPAPSLRDFMLTIKTKKVIFHKEELDITDDVLAALNKTK